MALTNFLELHSLKTELVKMQEELDTITAKASNPPKIVYQTDDSDITKILSDSHKSTIILTEADSIKTTITPIEPLPRYLLILKSNHAILPAKTMMSNLPMDSTIILRSPLTTLTSKIVYWAKHYHHNVEIVSVDKADGKKSKAVLNNRLVTDYNLTAILCFIKQLDKVPGETDLIKKARKAGIPVYSHIPKLGWQS